MKKILLSFVLLFCFATQQTYSQCLITNTSAVIVGIVPEPNGTDCTLTFNFQFDIDYNGGAKKLFLHLWELNNYNTSHSGFVYTNSSQPEYNDGSSDPLNILFNSITTVALDIDGNTNTITALTSYSPDIDAPISVPTASDITSVAIPATTLYHVEINGITKTVPTSSLAFGCSVFNTFKGDIWASQANGSNPAVHCPLVAGFTVLPVEFVSFNATRNGKNVNLIWQTSSEQNNKGFDIERLIGNGDWQKLAFVASKAKAGSSNNNIDYQFTDFNNTNGVSQYRLKQIDIDGRSSYSSIKLVRGLDQKAKTMVFPNPSFDGRVSVMFEEANVVRNISLVDINGRVVKQWKGVSNNNIQVENLNPGFYTLRIVNTSTNKQTVEKFIINKR
jgi:hypothetical protein